MATDLENSIRNAAERVVKYIEAASILQVETRYLEVGADGTGADGGGPGSAGQGKQAAYTEIKLDADSTTVVPVRRTQAGDLEVDTALFDVHQKSVASAIEYRSRILDALLNIFQSRGK